MTFRVVDPDLLELAAELASDPERATRLRKLKVVRALDDGNTEYVRVIEAVLAAAQRGEPIVGPHFPFDDAVLAAIPLIDDP